MFTAADTSVYNGQEQTPAVSAVDMQMVGGSSTNIISTDDYACAYSDNVHAGTDTGKVTITAAADGNYSGSASTLFSLKKAEITVTAASAQSVYACEIADLTGHYSIYPGEIYSEADREDLAIKAVTRVQRGYDAKTYSGAVKIEYNTGNTDYDVTTIAADYTVTPADHIKVTSTGYNGIYDSDPHGISVHADDYKPDDGIQIYYSKTEVLNKNNYKSAGSMTNPQFTAAGSYTVYFCVISTKGNYGETSGSAQVNIAKRQITVTPNAHTMTYGGKPENISDVTGADTKGIGGVSVSGLAGSDTASEKLDGAVTYTSADYAQYDDTGVYTITPAGLSSSDYEIKYVPGVLTVMPKKVTFTWPDEAGSTFAYNGSSHGVTASVNAADICNSDDVIVGSYDSDNDSNIRNNAVHAGNFTAKVSDIAGKKAGNYTFDDNDQTSSHDWKITKASNKWTVTPTIQNWTTGDPANEPIGASLFGTPSYSYSTSENGEYQTAAPTDAGTYFMKADVTENEDYEALSLTNPIQFTITEKSAPATIYATIQDKSITYGDTVGTVTVKYTDVSGNSVKEDSLGLSGTLTYTTEYRPGDAVRGCAGQYDISPSGQTTEAYNLVFRNGTLTVEKKRVSLSWSGSEYEYNGRAQSVTADVDAADVLDGDSVYVSSYTGNTATAAGNYTAQAVSLGGTGSQNYLLPDDASHSWKIDQAENGFIINPAISDWYYGEKPSQPNAVSKYGTVVFKYKKDKEGIADWGIFNPASSEVPTDAGDYVLIAEVAAGDGYKSLKSSEMNFSIKPVEMTITALNSESEYGYDITSPLLYSSVVMRGVVDSADASSLGIKLTTDASALADAATYPITVTYKNNSNIIVTTIDGAYTINRASMTATAQNVTVYYDGKPHTISEPVVLNSRQQKPAGVHIYYSWSQLESGDFGNGEDTPKAITDADSKTLYYYVTAENYDSFSGSAVVTVLPKEVTVKANDSSVIYGENAENDGVSYDGLQNGDTAESLGLAPSYTYTYASEPGRTYAPGSSAGTYTIMPGGLDSHNYSFTYNAGVMTVDKKPLTESMFTPSDDTFTYDGTSKELLFAVSDKTGAMQGKELITESDYAQAQYADNIHAGESTATATFEASENGNYSGAIVKRFSIGKAKLVMNAISASSVYNEPIKDISGNYQIGSGNIVSGDDLDLHASTVVKKGYAAGTYNDAVTVLYDTTNTDYDVTVNKSSYTVDPAELIVQESDYSGVYDGKKHKGEVTAKTGNLLQSPTVYYSTEGSIDSDADCTGKSTETIGFKEFGKHIVWYRAVCDNYRSVSGSITVDIKKAPLTVTVSDESMVYGEDPSAAVIAGLSVADMEFNGFIGSDSYDSEKAEDSAAVFTTDYKQYDSVGTYDIGASGLKLKDYAPSYVSGTLTVNKKNVSFTWPSGSGTVLPYNGQEQYMTAEVSASSKARSTDEVSVGTYASNKNVYVTASATTHGRYTARVESLSGKDAGNYSFDQQETTAEQIWSIVKAQNSFTITPYMGGWTEGQTAENAVGTAKFGDVTFTYSSSENGAYTANVPTTAGTWYMKAQVPETLDYYGLEKVVLFEIKEAAHADVTVTITAPGIPAGTLTYGDALDTSAYTLSYLVSNGMVEGIPAGKESSDVLTGTLSYETSYERGDDAGTYEIMPKGLTAKTGYKLVFRPGDIVVSKKNVSLTWTSDEFTYDGTEKVITASVTSGLYGNDSIVVTGYKADIANKVRNSAISAGEYTAKAISFAGKGYANYTIDDGSAAHNWKIDKAKNNTQYENKFTVAPAIDGWTYGQSASTPTGTAKYGDVHFEYSSAANGIYTSDRPAHAGTWFMKGIVAETSDYEAIESSPVSFAISKSKVTISADDKTTSRRSALMPLTYKTSGTIAAGDNLGITLISSVTATSPVGDYKITVGYDDTNQDYDITAVAGTYHIIALSSGLQVTASGYSGAYDGKSHGITVTVTAGGQVPSGLKIYYSKSVLDDKNYGGGSTDSAAVSLKDVGTQTVYYYITTDDYKDVPGSKDIQITQKDVTVTANDISVTYGNKPESAQGLGVRYSGFAEGEDADTLSLVPTYSYTYSQYKKSGNYIVTPKGLPTNGNYKYTYVRGKLVANPKPVTFTWSEDEFNYDNNEKSIAASVSGLENGDVIAPVYADDASNKIVEKAVSAGDYKATVTGLSGNMASSYTIDEGETSASHNWKIYSVENGFSAAPSINGWTYGDTPSEPTGRSLYGDVKFMYSTETNGTYTEMKPTDAGSYFMKAVVTLSGDYEKLESTPVGFSIAKADIIVTANNLSSRQGSDIIDLNDPENKRYLVTGKAADGDVVNVTLSTAATAASPDGEYPITISGVTVSKGVSGDDSTENYNVTKKGGTYRIFAQTRNINVSAKGTDCVYDGTEHGIDVTVSGDDSEYAKVYYNEGSMISSEDPSAIISGCNGKTESPTKKNVSDTTVNYYIIYDNEADTDPAEFITKGTASVSISKAPLTIQVDDAKADASDENSFSGFGYKCVGLVDGDTASGQVTGTPAYSWSYNAGDGGGLYSVSVTGLSSENYNISYKSGKLTVVEKVDIYEVSAAKNLVYNGEPQIGYTGSPSTLNNKVTQFTYTYYKNPFVQSDPALSGAPADAGSYTLLISVPSDNPYFKSDPKEISFTISKKTVTVSPRDQVIIAGGNISKDFVSYSGFCGNDSEESMASHEDIDKPVVILSAGADTQVAGKYTNAISINAQGASIGKLTDEAQKNYELTAAGSDSDSTLTVLAKQASDDGGSVSIGDGTVKTAVVTDEEVKQELNPSLETNLDADKAAKLLTTEEKDEVKEGGNALIYLELEKAGDDVQDDKDMIADKAKTVDDSVYTGDVEYLKLSLYKKVGDSTPEKITNTEGTNVTVTVILTGNLINSDPDNIIRSYRIVYEHDGQTKMITPTVNGDVLTFTTAEFSTYGIVFFDKDKVTPPAPGGGDNPGGGSGSGGDSGNNDDDDSDSGSGTIPAKKPAVTSVVTPTPAVTQPASGTPANGSGSGNKGKGDGTGSQSGDGSGMGGQSGNGSGTGSQSGNGNGAGSDNGGKGSGGVDSGSKQTQKPEISDGKDVSPKIEKQLDDAFSKITGIDPDIKAGPYVVLNADGKGELSFDIPSDLKKDGRTFYVMAVAKDGSVVIIPNESIEDGTFSFSGDPDLTYQIIYEDGGAKLSENIGENGVLTGEDGKAVKVSTASGCFYHWIILVTGLIGIALLYIFRRKKKRPAVLTVIFAIDTALMIMLVMIGYCVWDKVFMVVGVVLMALVLRMKINSESFQKEQRSS